MKIVINNFWKCDYFLHGIIPPELYIGDQAMYNWGPTMRCLVKSKRYYFFPKVLDGVQRVVLINGFLDISFESNMKIVSRSGSKYLIKWQEIHL